MFYVLSWFTVVALLAVWSLACWALHAVAAWAISSTGALTGAAAGAGTLTVPEGLAPWLPTEVAVWASELSVNLAPIVEGVLQLAPALAGGLTFVTWLIWGIGSVLFLLLGAGLHMLIALWRRRSSGGSGPRAGSPLAVGQ